MSPVALFAVALAAWLLLILLVLTVLRAARLADENTREADLAHLKSEVAEGGEADVEALPLEWPGGAAG